MAFFYIIKSWEKSAFARRIKITSFISLNRKVCVPVNQINVFNEGFALVITLDEKTKSCLFSTRSLIHKRNIVTYEHRSGHTNTRNAYGSLWHVLKFNWLGDEGGTGWWTENWAEYSHFGSLHWRTGIVKDRVIDIQHSSSPVCVCFHVLVLVL